MKVMKYFAAASLMLFAACNNEDNPTLAVSYTHLTLPTSDLV